MKSEREKDIPPKPKTLEQMYPSIRKYQEEVRKWEEESLKNQVLSGGHNNDTSQKDYLPYLCFPK